MRSSRSVLLGLTLTMASFAADAPPPPPANATSPPAGRKGGGGRGGPLTEADRAEIAKLAELPPGLTVGLDTLL